MSAHKIMIVDDEPMIRESLVEFLEDHGYEAVGAADGRDAMSKLNGSGPLPSLILLDMMMPFMDGRAFREVQMATPGLSRIPVIVFSAYRDLERTAEELQAVAHLPKPLKLQDLLRLVRQHCGESPLA